MCIFDRRKLRLRSFNRSKNRLHTSDLAYSSLHFMILNMTACLYGEWVRSGSLQLRWPSGKSVPPGGVNSGQTNDDKVVFTASLLDAQQ